MFYFKVLASRIFPKSPRSSPPSSATSRRSTNSFFTPAHDLAVTVYSRSATPIRLYQDELNAKLRSSQRPVKSAPVSRKSGSALETNVDFRTYCRTLKGEAYSAKELYRLLRNKAKELGLSTLSRVLFEKMLNCLAPIPGVLDLSGMTLSNTELTALSNWLVAKHDGRACMKQLETINLDNNEVTVAGVSAFLITVKQFARSVRTVSVLYHETVFNPSPL